ncbi:MAG: TetR/AcrR family transcriptional regulator [Acidimicrobiia bacterium]|nr:TetR/AcrR family transcriptional regulator [Acidimicrobiia bacterium]
MISTLDTASPAERRRSRLRAHIADVALDLFCDGGYDETTVDDIAAAADISTRSFFRYFRAKEEVLFHDALETIETLRALVDDRPAGEPLVVSLREALVGLIALPGKDPERDRRRLQLLADTPHLEAAKLAHEHQWETALAAVLAGRLGADPAADLRPALAAASAIAALRIVLEHWLASDAPRPADEVVTEAFDAMRVIWSED